MSKRTCLISSCVLVLFAVAVLSGTVGAVPFGKFVRDLAIANKMLEGSGIFIRPIDNNDPPKSTVYVGIRVEPPVGVRIKGTVKWFSDMVVEFADSEQDVPWMAVTGQTEVPYDWGLSLFSLPPGGLEIMDGMQEDPSCMVLSESDGMLTLTPIPTSQSDLPGGPGVLTRRRDPDHVGQIRLIEQAARLIDPYGVSLYCEVERGILEGTLRIQPGPIVVEGAHKEELDLAGTKVDIAGTIAETPWFTVDCPPTDATASPRWRIEVLSIPSGGIPLTYFGGSQDIAKYKLSGEADGGITLVPVP